MVLDAKDVFLNRRDSNFFVRSPNSCPCSDCSWIFADQVERKSYGISSTGQWYMAVHVQQQKKTISPQGGGPGLCRLLTGVQTAWSSSSCSLRRIPGVFSQEDWWRPPGAVTEEVEEDSSSLKDSVRWVRPRVPVVPPPPPLPPFSVLDRMRGVSTGC